MAEPAGVSAKQEVWDRSLADDRQGPKRSQAEDRDRLEGRTPGRPESDNGLAALNALEEWRQNDVRETKG